MKQNLIASSEWSIDISFNYGNKDIAFWILLIIIYNVFMSVFNVFMFYFLILALSKKRRRPSWERMYFFLKNRMSYQPNAVVLPVPFRSWTVYLIAPEHADQRCSGAIFNPDCIPKSCKYLKGGIRHVKVAVNVFLVVPLLIRARPDVP